MRLFRLLLRSLLAFGLLSLLGRSAAIPVTLPGANPVTALVMGSLGAPGFALLLLLPVILS